MAFEPGTKLGRYEIRAKIGEGGMGEVYRAQDTELDRPVALKFLSSELASHERRLKRFIQEAKAASALNHPNILTVYEIGRAGEANFLATEFIDGLTLRQRMIEGLKLNEVLDYAMQVASALVAAHAVGIVHRDIKPDNVMVRADGIVKVLDFGLAKLTERQPSLSSGSESPTLALIKTEPGALMGTVAYMSPEQAAGLDVDARSDIWSLGVMLYEMIAGRPPFGGLTKSHIIVAITDREPAPVTQFALGVPEGLEWIIAEALTKDREERCQTAKELLSKLKRLKQRIESGLLPTSISDLDRSLAPKSTPETSAATLFLPESPTLGERARSTTTPGALSTAPTVSSAQFIAEGIQRHRKAAVAAIVLGAVVVSAIGWGLYKLVSRNEPPAPAKMTALTTGGKLSGEDINGQVSISPDGKWVVCAANDAKQQASLWVRQVSTGSVMRIVPPENGGYLATTFSPDGEFIYYVATLERNSFVPTLFRIPVIGGTAPVKVLERVSGAIAFSPKGEQFAFVRDSQESMALMVANTDGAGQPKVLAERKKPNGFSVSGPSWSPDGNRIACGAFTASGAGQATVVEVPVAGGEPTSIGSEKWASVGRVIWLADGNGLILTAQPESSSIGTQIWMLPYPNGRARRITNDLNGYGEVSLGLTSDSGTIATIQQVNTSSIWITAPNEDENRALQIVKTNLPETVSWTPDGRIVYASRTGENWDLWIANRDGSDTRQLMADAFIDQQPSVSGDGRYIVFQSNRSGSRNIWRIDIDGGNLKQLTEGNQVDANPVVSNDGGIVVFMSERSGKGTIWKVGIDGGSPTQLTNQPSQLPSVSPDGKLIAYIYVDEEAHNQPKVSIIPFDGGEPVKTIALPRSAPPITFAWMPDGRSIAYLDAASGILNIWSQPIDGGPPRQLTNFKSELMISFAISRDGRLAIYRFSATRDIVLIKGFG